MQHTVKERFLRYVKIDTQSDPTATTYPTSTNQQDLSRLLVAELQAMGVTDAHLDEHGYVYATIPATTTKTNVPVICFCSHVDTAPDCSGKDVKPLIHANYQGQDIVLPDDPTVVIRMAEHPALAAQIGNDIITASGKTLLGADNKAGVAAIMDAAHHLMQHPELPHGTIKILFTPDEEVGHGVENVDLKKLGADFGYTIDGETVGTIEDETFSADGAVIHIQGVSAHPGFAKGKLVHAMKIAGEILAQLPRAYSPEHTAGKEGFVHPTSIQGKLEECTITFIVRDFEDEKLAQHHQLLQNIMNDAVARFPGATATYRSFEQYRNMKQILANHPEVVENAMEAIARAGITPIRGSIRGGTDGSRLSFMGLPCPNIFAGEHAFHSKQEWVSVQDMQKAAQTIVHLSLIWEEKA